MILGRRTNVKAKMRGPNGLQKSIYVEVESDETKVSLANALASVTVFWCRASFGGQNLFVEQLT